MQQIDPTGPQFAQDLEHFRAVQQLAYACCEAVGRQLQPGMTEKDAAEMLRAWLNDKGVRDWLHKPRGQLNVARFGINSTLDLVKQVGQGHKEGWSPLWSVDKRSQHAPQPGLWAVEPHLGRDGVGAKFEELLVITADDAFWLDDDLPHVRRWQQRHVKVAA